MRIREIIWLPEIVEKIERKHRVVPHEVRELMNNRPRIFFAKLNMWKENIYTRH